MDSKKGTSPNHWRTQDIRRIGAPKIYAEEILYSTLTSTDILIWNARGEIMYRGQNMRGTNIIDLIQYVVLLFHHVIPEPEGLGISQLIEIGWFG